MLAPAASPIHGRLCLFAKPQTVSQSRCVALVVNKRTSSAANLKLQHEHASTTPYPHCQALRIHDNVIVDNQNEISRTESRPRPAALDLLLCFSSRTRRENGRDGSISLIRRLAFSSVEPSLPSETSTGIESSFLKRVETPQTSFHARCAVEDRNNNRDRRFVTGSASLFTWSRFRATRELSGLFPACAFVPSWKKLGATRQHRFIPHGFLPHTPSTLWQKPLAEFSSPCL